MSATSRIRTTLLALAVLLAFRPLQAQMDPRLQSSVTDLLDVYKVNSAPPELLTVFDFSGSMHAVYWDSRYYTSTGQTGHNPQWDNMTSGTGGDFPGIVPCLDKFGYLWMVEGTGYYQSIYTTSQASQFQMSGGNPTAQLVAPNGTVISIPHTGALSQTALTAYVQQASHIRVTATASVNIGGTPQTVTRTMDLPIPWAIMDKNTSSNNAFATLTYLVDPLNASNAGNNVYPDGLYAVPSQNNIVNNASSGLYKIGRFHYNKDYLWWVFFGTDSKNPATGVVSTLNTFTVAAQNDSLGGGVEPAGYPATSWNNGLTGMTRFQALKYAAIKAWFDNEGTDPNKPPQVWWGYRFLDDTEDGSSSVNTDNGSASSTKVTRDIRLFNRAAGGVPSSGVSHFRDMEPSTSTPLTHAFANAYAQLALTNDAQSTFGTGNGKALGQNGTDTSPIPPCRKSFVVVFTDGIANDSGIGSGDPYAAGTEPAGNTALGSPSSLLPGKGNFNSFSLAGAAAHYIATDPTTGKPIVYVGPTKGSYSLDKYEPYLVTSRGATTSAPRRIRTMTVGMSLAGTLSDASSGKADLFRAALYGNPDTKSWSLSTKPFDPNDPSSDPTVNPFYFDATDVTTLSGALTAILAEVTGGSASVAAPASPLVGLSLGNQAYLGLFQTVKGPRWKGDLLMAGLYIGPKGVTFLDDSGNAVSTVNDQNAIWSVNQDVFLASGGRGWKGRNIYTNLPGTTTLVQFDEGTTAITNAMLGVPDNTTRNAYMRFMMGAGPTAEAAASKSAAPATDIRNDIMGDIINSAPTVLEYPMSAIPSSSFLASLVSSGAVPSGATPHFRVIFAGDNQGIFHAFGEVSWTTQGTITFYTTTIDPVTGDPVTTTTTTTGLIPHGKVDELWAFIPGEYLGSIGQLRARTNPHRYMVDGTPTVYFKDVPAAGQVRGDGIVNGSDVVRVIAGERKGGRSYYAFDFSDLSKVMSNTAGVMAWKLVPDDVASTATGQQNVIRHMGYSTTTPAIGRVNTASAVDQDLVFLGGGLSTQAVDSAFAGDSTFSDSSAKLGRSIVAFDVVNGPSTNLYTWNFNDSTFTTKFGAMGCIPAGVVPMEFFQGSAHTQRVYFADSPTDPNATSTSPRGGGVWALGNTGLAVNGVIRLDSSSIDDWTGAAKSVTTQGVRHIFQTPTGWSITTTPTPFLLNGPYPAIRTVDPKSAPVAVGISFGTGDRNDPMDNDSINPIVSGTAYNNWMNVIFDRQDSSSLSGVSGVATTNLDTPGIQQGKTNSDGDIADLTTVSAFTGTFNGYSVDPANSAFYLKQKLGYKLNMGAATAKSGGYFFPKVITNSVVLNGVLFFSDFLPANGTDACKGTGITNTYRICNVLQPTFNSGSANASPTSFNGGDPTCSGIVLTYPNLPGEITALGTAAVIQSGQGSNGGNPGTISNAGAQVGGSFGKTGGFGFKPRSWRIVR